LLEAETVPEQIRTRAGALLQGDFQQSLKFIQSSVLRLSGIIDSLLQLSRVGRVEYSFRPLDLNAIVARIVESMSAELFERGVEIRVAELPPCHGDATAVEQVFANLIGNAVKYLDGGRPGEIEVGAMAENAQAAPTYYVRDNGIGVPAACREKIFQAFQRAHPKHAPGEGMGLAIVRRIVQRHGGRVWVESTEGQSSTFWVALPNQSAADSKSAIYEERREKGDRHDKRTDGDLVGGRR